MSRTHLAFSARLADLLATLETSALLGAAEGRVRGLGEHLRFACMAMPCADALVALEIEALGRLLVPAVATREGYVHSDLSFAASGSLFAHLLAGGGGHALSLEAHDPLLAPFAAALSSPPASAVVVPIRSGDLVLGGAAFFSAEPSMPEAHLEMAERLGEVLSLTVESFRTERLLYQLFARALPSLLGEEGSTHLGERLAEHIHDLRVDPVYRRRLELALEVGRLAEVGAAEAELAGQLVRQIARYAGQT